MSMHLMSLVWEITFPTQSQKLTMLRLADYANDDGKSVFPSVATIAWHVGCERRTAQYALGAFEGVGLLRKIHIGGSGPKDVNNWEINTELLCELALKNQSLAGNHKVLELVEITGVIHKGANVAPLISKRVQSAALRVQSTTDKGAASFTQDTNNHQLEPLSAQEDAQKGEFVDLKGVNLAAIHITDHEPAWAAWIDELKARGEYQLADKAEATGSLIVANRWPLKSSPLPKVPKQPPGELAKATAAKKAKDITKETE